jgi:CRP/FNR family cyclic AMP-dependent transcriptional regulator
MTSQTELRILTALRSMEPLHDLDSQHLKKLASIAVERKFPEGEIIYKEGDLGQAIYLVQAGEVVIEMEVPEVGRATVLVVGPGQLFGWSSLFPPRRKGARARVAKPMRAIVIEAGKLRHLFQSDHALEFAITQRITAIVADRVKATRMQLVKAVSGDKS